MNRSERRAAAKRVPRSHDGKRMRGKEIQAIRSAIARKLHEKEQTAQQEKSAEELGLTVVRAKDLIEVPKT